MLSKDQKIILSETFSISLNELEAEMRLLQSDVLFCETQTHPAVRFLMLFNSFRLLVIDVIINPLKSKLV
jgi:hypothetical protein